MKYNGIELIGITEPQIFNPPKKMICKYCNGPNKTLAKHRCGVEAFVGAGRLFLKLYDKKAHETTVSVADINYCPMCGRKLI